MEFCAWRHNSIRQRLRRHSSNNHSLCVWHTQVAPNLEIQFPIIFKIVVSDLEQIVFLRFRQSPIFMFRSATPVWNKAYALAYFRKWSSVLVLERCA